MGSLDYIKQDAADFEEYTVDESDYVKTLDYVENYLGLQMVYVEGGMFTMGCTPEQGDDCADDEYPLHQVTLSSYYISKYEVTQAQFVKVMYPNPDEFVESNNCSWQRLAEKPMSGVTWYKAVEFCERLSEMTGKKYVLPTEAQWEFAARGGVESKGYKYSGSDNIEEVAWCWDATADLSTLTMHKVGTKRPNELGIYDMSGNVEEWCADVYESYSSEAVTNHGGYNFGLHRVVRGGGYSFDRRGYDYRVSYRSFSVPDNDLFIGFRVVCIP